MSDYLWVEKYRPQTIQDTILPESLKKTFSEIVKSGDISNMLFTGSAGVGKTTIAKALCTECKTDYIVINASTERGIDIIRDNVRRFATTLSLYSSKKVIILDEADQLTGEAQKAIRGVFEEFHDNCRFILTCNYESKLIPAIRSRCSEYNFSIPSKEKAVLSARFYNRIIEILDKENIEYDVNVIRELITKYYPDWRRLIVELQRYSMGGKIDAGILTTLTDTNIKSLIDYLKNKNWKSMRSWIVENMDSGTNSIYRSIYDSMAIHIKPESIPTLILIIAEYQYKDAFVIDHEINTVACMTEIMSSVEFK
jgi:DNA polymerase III delta prime subunit